MVDNQYEHQCKNRCLLYFITIRDLATLTRLRVQVHTARTLEHCSITIREMATVHTGPREDLMYWVSPFHCNLKYF